VRPPPPGRTLRDRTAEYEAATFPEATLTALWLLGRVPPSALERALPGVAVFRPGRAGRGPGPDVREATLLLRSGATLSGDVEVHLRASDFVRHGHREDPAYARVILHLCWEDDRTPDERGGPTRLPPATGTAAAGLAPTVTLAEVMPDPRQVEVLVARGPSGAEPCTAAAMAWGQAEVAERVRDEGRKRLAERAWRAWRLADRYGFPVAFDRLLERALASTAGRVREGDERRVLLAAAIRAGLGADPVMRLEASARDGRVTSLVALFRVDGIGAGRATEIAWNVALPLLSALAAAYDDLDLARATASLVAAWPSPRPYGRTRSLASGIGVGRADGRSALHAQGLLHLQDLWCSRGGCGVCPLSPVSQTLEVTPER
jgi:hypothetical protein